MKIYAIIPAGGEGKRTGYSLPKQYCKFNGKELIVYSLEIFEKCDLIDDIVVSLKSEYFNLLKELIKKYKLNKISELVEGGKERQDSVNNALSQIPAVNDDLIVIHDAARPLLPLKVLNDSIISAKKYDNIVVAIKARDTLLEGDDCVSSYLDRKQIYYAQTPQIFRFKVLKDAMAKASNDKFYGTDESRLVHRASYNIKIVEGSMLNFKVTTDSDMELFDIIAKSL